MSLAAALARLVLLSAFLWIASSLGGAETASARQVVAFPAEYPPGTIVISQRQRRLYLTLGDGRAIRYPVAVGKAGKAWSGWARVDGKHVNPAWSPPYVVRRDNPHLPDFIPGGSPSNPMGPRALTLDRSEIAIHGTTQAMRRSIGTAASYGCIRMLNEDIVDLFDRVRVGTAVVSIP
jgi:lipoprotein-anchoring transpeptidase ErfK/SrfK